MRYLKGHRENYGVACAGDEWGAFTVYLEIDDQHVTRQINEYEQGQLLRYDRSHWCDDFGYMFIGKFSRKQKATRGYEVIDVVEFNKKWRQALQSELWTEQVGKSRVEQWGTWSDRVSSEA
ncbi:MAG: hypothetical protein DWQ34_18375 [Planctomycetota bacterium]|nr:MAG: hypothetical protein DWQ34_18375 [Planctomycetota bacterium]REJ95984.1 MAG: hypothetical protein DWQ29_01395 [Planctomycetota bacterium]REK21539.1 MAG: hypothetical protein DWQ41_20935 [Planctomycetota bacterium]REK39906.1 MAG: hypothetical protein DWQ45_01160 [Planctomycetota bacterium]